MIIIIQEKSRKGFCPAGQNKFYLTERTYRFAVSIITQPCASDALLTSYKL